MIHILLMSIPVISICNYWVKQKTLTCTAAHTVTSRTGTRHKTLQVFHWPCYTQRVAHAHAARHTAGNWSRYIPNYSYLDGMHACICQPRPYMVGVMPCHTVIAIGH